MDVCTKPTQPCRSDLAFARGEWYAYSPLLFLIVDRQMLVVGPSAPHSIKPATSACQRQKQKMRAGRVDPGSLHREKATRVSGGAGMSPLPTLPLTEPSQLKQDGQHRGQRGAPITHANKAASNLAGVGAVPKMKGLSVTLLLLFLTGTQARHFWQQDEPPPPPLERLREQFQRYLESASASAREVVAQLDASNFGQHFDLDMATKVEMVAAVAEQLKEQLSPSYQAIRERLHSDYQELTADLVPIKAKLTPLVDDLQRNLHEAGQAYFAKLKPLVQEWQQSARQDLEELQGKVAPVAAEARDKLRVLVADFRQKAAPYVEEVQQAVRQKVQQVQERAVPRVQEFHTIVQEQVNNLREAMTPVVEGVRQRLGPALKNLQDRLAALLTTIQRNLEQQNPQQS